MAVIMEMTNRADSLQVCNDGSCLELPSILMGFKWASSSTVLIAAYEDSFRQVSETWGLHVTEYCAAVARDESDSHSAIWLTLACE